MCDTSPAGKEVSHPNSILFVEVVGDVPLFDLLLLNVLLPDLEANPLVEDVPLLVKQESHQVPLVQLVTDPYHQLVFFLLDSLLSLRNSGINVSRVLDVGLLIFCQVS